MIKTLRAKTGFTLIELLIVILIISIIASFATLSISVNENKRLEAISQQLVNLLVLAEQEAILRPATIGFGLTNTHFKFYVLQKENAPEKKNQWEELKQSALKTHPIPSDVFLKLRQDKKTSIPQIIFTQGGDVTPFSIFIGKKGKAAIFKVTGLANGTIKSERIN